MALQTFSDVIDSKCKIGVYRPTKSLSIQNSSWKAYQT